MLVLATAIMGPFPDPIYSVFLWALFVGALGLGFQYARTRRLPGVRSDLGPLQILLCSAWLATLPVWIVGWIARGFWDRVVELKEVLGPFGSAPDVALLSTLYLGVTFAVFTLLRTPFLSFEEGSRQGSEPSHPWGEPDPRAAKRKTLILLGVLCLGSLLFKPIWFGLDPGALAHEAYSSETEVDPWGTPWRTQKWLTYSLGPNGVDETQADYGYYGDSASNKGDDIWLAAQGLAEPEQRLFPNGPRYVWGGRALALLAFLVLVSYLLARRVPPGATLQRELARIGAISAPLVVTNVVLVALLSLSRPVDFHASRSASMPFVLGLSLALPFVWPILEFRLSRYPGASRRRLS